ncbi:hypothetical protein E2C01_041457 [Portunus trituberculatus]|uniref:Uncharacterized protein n=1 Tax=Portunus trituberculatus TaxID=210409 RepID=A0A5B7FRS0_PORTR|nr:hypothetical protein [Portunus trituberculatus]
MTIVETCLSLSVEQDVVHQTVTEDHHDYNDEAEGSNLVEKPPGGAFTRLDERSSFSLAPFGVTGGDTT